MRNLFLILALLYIPDDLGFRAYARALSPFPSDDFQFTRSWDCTGIFRGGKPHKAAFFSAMILGNQSLDLTEQDVQVEIDANNFGRADSFTVDWQISKTPDLSWTEADHLVCKRSKS